jgi:uncharacterized protein
MEYQPSLELLEATHEFPGPFMFKVVGFDEDNFTGRVLASVRACLPEEVEPAFSVRRTASGKHACVTIEPTVERAADVITIYRKLKDVAGVTMLF